MSGVRARILIALMVVIALVGVTGPSWSALPATAQVPVFSEAARQPAGDTRLGDPTIVRARYVDVNLATMDGTPRAGGAPVGRGDVLTLNLFPYQSSLFPEVTVTAVRDRVVPSSTGQGYVWSGYVQGSNASVSPVTITVEGGVMIANVRANGAAYQVRHTPSGVQAIYQLDEQHVPPHDHVYLSYADANRSAAILAASRAQSPAAATKAPAPAAVRDTGTTIDVLIAYTANARAAAGPTSAAILGEINTAIGEANTAFANSQVPQSLRPVGTMEVNYNAAPINSPTGFLPDLQCVAGTNSQNQIDPNSTCLASIRQMREQVRADVVSLWVEGQLGPGTSGTVGIAFVINSSFAPGGQLQGPLLASYAYSVVAAKHATSPAFTFAHEVGHNLGANHDRITDAGLANPPLYPFAFDYIAPNNVFRTVMAYGDKCGQCRIILNFSNPAVSDRQTGRPTGSASEDNHQTLINTISTVINYRQCNQDCGGGGGGGSTSTPTPTPTTPPSVGLANDNFANATVVSSLPATLPTLTTTSATIESGEPSPTCGSIGRTVWYRFTPSATTQVTVTTVGSSFDTVLGVYTGSAVNGLTQVACNDDAGGSNRAQVSFTATAGTTYRIQVGGFGGVGGTLLVAMTGTIVAATSIPAAVCTPTRPTVTVNAVRVGANQLQVTVTRGGNALLQQLQFGAATNALIDVPVAGLTGVTGNRNVSLPVETTTTTFTVHQATAGQSTTVPLTVVDGCGNWPTFVGGGADAF